ncbi:uncharacterized protein LOC135488714 [Lineus longissimus]|uniref:uncharacterized protein LOC135488714 n=1 Tax=Lineus longissimus TaxID=88925 RepID=UPI00315CB26D
MNRIFVMDSRGLKLRHQRPIYANEQWIVKPGGTIQALQSKAEDAVEKLQQLGVADSQIQIILGAGICNLTEKKRSNSGVEVNYNANGNAHKTIEAINHFKDQFELLGIRVLVIPIPPVSIIKYNDYLIKHGKLHIPEISQAALILQQRGLENDIEEINSHIWSVNWLAGLKTPRWERDLLKFQVKRGKRYKKHTYHELYDGVHPTNAPAGKWLKYLIRAIEDQGIANAPINVQEEDDDDDDNDDVGLIDCGPVNCFSIEDHSYRYN